MISFVKRFRIELLVLIGILLLVSCKSADKTIVTYSLPNVTDDATSPSGKKTVWECVYFGSFPQVEVLDDIMQTHVDDYAVDDGIIRSRETYNAIISLLKKEDNASEDHDIMYNGEKYRVERDVSTEYRIFKYMPIKWRIVDVEGDILTLLSDKIPMSTPYSFESAMR